MPTAYEVAQASARATQGRLTVAQARAIQRALLQFAEKIGAALRSMGSRSSELEATRRIIEAEAARLGDAISKAVESGRTLTFESVLEVWERAGVDFAQARGVSIEDLTRLRVAPVTIMGAFENLAPGAVWRTILPRYAGAAGQEVVHLIRQAFIEDIGPDELSRRLRRYVVGSEPFDKLFTNVPTLGGSVAKIDLRKIPINQRGAARHMAFNAQRIAFSELHNARAEAEVQHFISDPLIEAVKWTLSPNRGKSWTPPDECDLLAATDFYGLGPGIYPVTKVPPPPHPFDRCERLPITRPVSRMRDPKPDPALQLDPRSSRVKFSRGGNMTATAAERARQSAWRALQAGLGIL